MTIEIRPASHADLPAISDLALAAFGTAEGPEIVQLIADLLVDPSAQPVLSLLATADERIIGHILFSKARLKPPSQATSAALLAPLAVHPEVQGRGIGGRLITEGLERLAGAGVEWVFVLGHPGYYPRFGFSEAGIQGFAAPFPIPPQNAAAWMLRSLRPGESGRPCGQVICADALADPKYWRE